MPRTSAQLQALREASLSKQLDFQSEHDVVAAQLLSTATRQTQRNTRVWSDQDTAANTQIEETLHNLDETLAGQATSISDEEQAMIFEKLTQVVHSPTTLSHDDLLYLEQQLADMYGHSISRTLLGVPLPTVGVTVCGLPHMSRHAADTLADHHSVLEAGYSSKRGIFSWSTTTQSNEHELYGVFLPLSLCKQPDQTLERTLSLLAQSKVLVIAPHSKRAVIAPVAGILSGSAARYGLGCTPETMRFLQLWQPTTHGSACLFVVENPEASVGFLE
ncbi:MAG: hypothetical protein H6774_04190 [Pseudomonadales bacterium]|nr:hypothetical protein [Candidatus Woesebacteria bacterium]MCB9802260.1 hypothetical protein [Pseudomonadales bacterium]